MEDMHEDSRRFVEDMMSVFVQALKYNAVRVAVKREEANVGGFESSSLNSFSLLTVQGPRGPK